MAFDDAPQTNCRLAARSIFRHGSTNVFVSWLSRSLYVMTIRDANFLAIAEVQPHMLCLWIGDAPTILVIWHQDAPVLCENWCLDFFSIETQLPQQQLKKQVGLTKQS